MVTSSFSDREQETGDCAIGCHENKRLCGEQQQEGEIGRLPSQGFENRKDCCYAELCTHKDPSLVRDCENKRAGTHFLLSSSPNGRISKDHWDIGGQ